jgi:hypothetical protein
LTPVDEASWPVLAALAGAIVFYAFYVLRRTWWPARQKDNGGTAEDFSDFTDAEPSRPLHETTRVKVMAEYQCDPLWSIDEDLYGCFAPADLGLSPELVADFQSWSDAYDNSYDADDPLNSRWTAEQQAAHVAEERALAVRLKRERPDLMVYVMEPEIGVVEVHEDGVASPWRGPAA